MVLRRVPLRVPNLRTHQQSMQKSLNTFSLSDDEECDMEEDGSELQSSRGSTSFLQAASVSMKYKSGGVSVKSRQHSSTRSSQPASFKRECVRVLDTRQESPASDLVKILQMQRFEGNWCKDDSLLGFMNMSKKKLMEEIERITGTRKCTDQEITTVVLVHLYTAHAGSETVWKLMFEKGLEYLRRSGIHSDIVQKIQARQM